MQDPSRERIRKGFVFENEGAEGGRYKGGKRALKKEWRISRYWGGEGEKGVDIVQMLRGEGSLNNTLEYSHLSLKYNYILTTQR